MAFASINKMTEAKAQTFSFSVEEANKILIPGDELSLFTPAIAGIETLGRNLLQLHQKQTRLESHARTLSEYYRAGKIPRGLRILKEPMIGRDDETFRHKWCEILNHCSMDLMLLIISQTKAEIPLVKSTIDTHIDEVKNMCDQKTFETLTQDIQSQLDVFKTELQQLKIKKFRRDTLDYKEDRVYTWLSRGRRYPGREAMAPSGWSSTSDTDTSTRQRRPRFLDQEATRFSNRISEKKKRADVHVGGVERGRRHK